MVGLNGPPINPAGGGNRIGVSRQTVHLLPVFQSQSICVSLAQGSSDSDQKKQPLKQRLLVNPYRIFLSGLTAT